MREQSRSDENLGVRYLRMALEYGRATRALLDGKQCEAPFWHSVGHALELSLKSLLKKHGLDEMDLMQFINHHLYRAERSYLRQCPDSQLISADASRPLCIIKTRIHGSGWAPAFSGRKRPIYDAHDAI